MNMLNKLRKISAVLAVCMSASVFPAVSFAEDLPEIDEIEISRDFGDREKNDEQKSDEQAPAETITDVGQDDAVEEISAPQEKRLSDVVLKEYKLLNKLAIVETDYGADIALTRGELAALLCRLAGIAEGSEKAFDDVGSGVANAKAIGLAADNGLMDGYADGTFGPYKKAEPSELIRAMLNLAGYGSIIKSEKDFESYAASCGFLVANLNEELTWKDAVKIIYRGLYLELIEIKGFGENGADFEKKNTILLEKLFGLTEGRGVVAATQYAALAGRKKTAKNRVTIDSKNGDWSYDTGDTDIGAYFGYKVRFYYYGDNDYTIAAYILDETDVVEISEEAFDDIDKSFTRIDYTVPDSSKSSHASLSPDAEMIYNGAEYYGVVRADFENADHITLIDSDDDGKYDVCSITDYETYFVDTISLKTGVLSDKRDGISFEIDENEYDVTYIKSGMETDMSIIRSGDTVRIARPKSDSDFKIMTVLVSSDLISGYVDSTDSSNRIAMIDGEQYYVSKKINIAKMRGNVSVGIDEYKKIICFAGEENPDKQYAWLMRVQNGEQADGYDAHIKAMNMYGEVVTYPLAEKFYINNRPKKPEELVSFAVSGVEDPEAEGNWYAKGQLIAYTFDGDGAIKRLFFAADADGSEKISGAIDPEDGNSLILNKKFSGRRTWDSYGSVNNEYIYTQDTYCFKIITDAEGRVVEDLSGMFNMGRLNVTAGTQPDVYVYDAGTSCIAKALVVKMAYSDIGRFVRYSTQALVVESVEDSVDADNTVVKEIRGYHSGNAVTYYVDENSGISADSWASGDMFIVTIGENGKIISADKFFSFSDKKVLSPENAYTADNPAVKTMSDGTLSATANYSEILNVAYGTVKEVINKNGIRAVRIRPEGSETDTIYNFSGTSVYIYHRGKKNKLEAVAIDDISRGVGSGKAVIYSRYGYARDVVIID